jgi:hypothetical protein
VSVRSCSDKCKTQHELPFGALANARHDTADARASFFLPDLNK